MSSLIRRIEKRIIKKAGYTRERFKIVNGKPVDCRRGGVITDADDDPIGYHWPDRIPASAKMPTRKVKRSRMPWQARGRRRGKHSKAWIESRKQPPAEQSSGREM